MLAGAAADPDESGFELVRLPRGPGHVRMAWLEHEAPLRATVLMGACLEDIVLDALARHDALAAHAAVGAWHECLVAASHESDIETPPNPFCRAGRRLLLPPEYVDVGLSNFIIDDHGDHHYVDQEWHGTGGVEVDIVVMRALLLLGATLVHRGLEHPWSPLTTPEDIAMEFAAALGVSDPHEAARAALDAEEEFQLRVAAGPLFKRDAGALRRLASSRRGPFKLNWLRLRRDLTRSHEQLAAAVERVEELAARLEHLTSVAERQEDEIQLWRQRWARLERRWPMRIMRSLRRLMP